MDNIAELFSGKENVFEAAVFAVKDTGIKRYVPSGIKKTPFSKTYADQITKITTELVKLAPKPFIKTPTITTRITTTPIITGKTELALASILIELAPRERVKTQSKTKLSLKAAQKLNLAQELSPALKTELTPKQELRPATKQQQKLQQKQAQKLQTELGLKQVTKTVTSQIPITSILYESIIREPPRPPIIGYPRKTKPKKVRLSKAEKSIQEASIFPVGFTAASVKIRRKIKRSELGRLARDPYRAIGIRALPVFELENGKKKTRKLKKKKTLRKTRSEVESILP